MAGYQLLIDSVRYGGNIVWHVFVGHQKARRSTKERDLGSERGREIDRRRGRERRGVREIGGRERDRDNSSCLSGEKVRETIFEAEKREMHCDHHFPLFKKTPLYFIFKISFVDVISVSQTQMMYFHCVYDVSSVPFVFCFKNCVFAH